MKNTGIIYSSTERTPVVLPEMAELLPPLSEEQLGALEADLLKNGCYTCGEFRKLDMLPGYAAGMTERLPTVPMEGSGRAASIRHSFGCTTS